MGFLDRLKNAWKIFATSFAFMGRDKSLLIVPLLMVLAGIALCVVFLLLLPWLMISPGRFPVTVVGFVFAAQFILTFLGAMQCWMVHEVAQGKDATVGSGLKRAVHEIGDILLYSIVFFLLALIPKGKRGKGGILNMLFLIIGEILRFLISVAGKLILPAMIITDRHFGQAVKQLKHAIRAWPEILLFEAGIRPLMQILFGIGFVFVIVTFFVMPMTAIAMLVILIVLIQLLTVFINNTYYTLLYLTLIEKKKVKGLKL